MVLAGGRVFLFGISSLRENRLIGKEPEPRARRHDANETLPAYLFLTHYAS